MATEGINEAGFSTRRRFRGGSDTLTARVSSTAMAVTWLTVMRWHAVGGQAAAVIVAVFALHMKLPVAPLLSCVALVMASNVGLGALARRHPDVGAPLIGSVLLFDVVILTLELGLSGGATNPFAIFYLVHILLAGLLLPGRWVIGITSIAAASYACLVAWPPLAQLSGDEQRIGRWVAFGFLAFFTAQITWRAANALRSGNLELLRRQRIASHAEKLASLSTLAAGAAHELGSPLGTITVASEELDALILEAPEEAIDDARVIREEVARCREIVHRMNARAGQLLGELPEPTTTGVILSDLRDQLSAAERRRLVVRAESVEDIECPARGLVRILGNLVTNAMQASERRGSNVEVSMRCIDDRIQFIVEDRGTGIPPSVASKLGEPFVTTKPPGKGMGLGLFLCFAFADLCAGSLELSARMGGGTSAILELPRRMKVNA